MPDPDETVREESSHSSVTFYPSAFPTAATRNRGCSSFWILFLPPFLAGWASGVFLGSMALFADGVSTLDQVLVPAALWTPFALLVSLSDLAFWLCTGACQVFATVAAFQNSLRQRIAASLVLGAAVSCFAFLSPASQLFSGERQGIPWLTIAWLSVIGLATATAAIAASARLSKRESELERKLDQDPFLQATKVKDE